MLTKFKIWRIGCFFRDCFAGRAAGGMRAHICATPDILGPVEAVEIWRLFLVYSTTSSALVLLVGSWMIFGFGAAESTMPSLPTTV